jgi:ABC-type transporter MlaC component
MAGMIAPGGFDDASNDRMAKGWGWDFAKHFTSGMQSYRDQRGQYTPTRMATAGSSNNVTVHVNVGEGGGGVDYAEVGRRVAWEVQKELRRSI